MRESLLNPGTLVQPAKGQPAELLVAVTDQTTAIVTGTAIITFPMPHGMYITNVYAFLATKQTSGSIFTVDIKAAGSTIFSTKITIDNTEDDSSTAATPPVLSTRTIAQLTKMTVNVDQIGDGTAKGLFLLFVGRRV